MSETVMRLCNISKTFGGIHALDDISLELKKGEVHALLGENGAGKSTLIKIITGVHHADSGDIFIDNQKTQIINPIDARNKGICAIYQELSLVNGLTVGENIFLGRIPSKTVFGVSDQKEIIKKSRELLSHFNIDVDPGELVENLGLGQRRVVEIVKAVSVDAKILLLDEPTTGMSQSEIDTLFDIIDELKKNNVTMIYISHQLEEVFRVCDRISVLRDGKNAGMFHKEEVSIPKLVGAMIGHEYDDTVVKAAHVDYSDRPAALEAIGFHAEKMKSPVSFKVHKGEILGITGIVGAGKSELAGALFGAEKLISGELIINGAKVSFASPIDARKHALAYIPEDRKGKGLFLIHSVEDNLSVANLELMSSKRCGMVVRRKQSNLTMDMAKSMRVKPLNMNMEARQLSGGNQQKVVLGKWLLGSPEIIILDEPTWGIDVGAKAEIYDFIAKLAEDGVSVILLSSEFKEILTLSNRILVLAGGRIIKELIPDTTSSEELLTLALGGNTQ